MTRWKEVYSPGVAICFGRSSWCVPWHRRTSPRTGVPQHSDSTAQVAPVARTEALRQPAGHGLPFSMELRVKPIKTQTGGRRENMCDACDERMSHDVSHAFAPPMVWCEDTNHPGRSWEDGKKPFLCEVCQGVCHKSGSTAPISEGTCSVVGPTYRCRLSIYIMWIMSFPLIRRIQTR